MTKHNNGAIIPYIAVLLTLACQTGNNTSSTQQSDVQAALDGQKTHQEQTLRRYMQETDESAGVLKDPQVICRTYNTLLHQCALVSDLGHPDLGIECRNHAITQCKSHACVWDDHHCISQEKAQQQESVSKHMQELETAAMNAAGDPNAKCRHFDRMHQTCELSNKMQLTHHLCNDSIDLCNQQNECTWNGTHCVHKQ